MESWENYPGGVLRREYLDLISQAFGSNVVEDYPLKSAAWGFLANLYDPADVTVPMLLVAGWYDLDNERSFGDWEALTAESPAAADHRLLIGAWHHFAVGGESGGAGRPLTTEELQHVDTQGRIQRDSLAWFEHHLRGQDGGVGDWAKVRIVQAGEDTWHDTATWPPPSVQDRTFFLRDTYSAKSTVTPGTRYEVEVPLTNQLAYTVATGHRLGLIVSSSNWPRFARNPGTGDDFMADTTSPRAVTNTVMCDAASYLRLSMEP